MLDKGEDPSKPTSSCWIGVNSNCFAIGYDDGSIIVWGITKAALSETSGAASDPVLVGSLRVMQDFSTPSSPIHSITFCFGTPGTPNAEDCLLVRGGQSIDDPEMLTLLPLDTDKLQDAVTLPWFGELKVHIGIQFLSQKKESTKRPSLIKQEQFDSFSVMMLTTGGQLVVHNLELWEPRPLTFPMQELPLITLSKVVPALSKKQAVSLQETAVQHSITVEGIYGSIRKNQKQKVLEDDFAVEDIRDWPFTAGSPCAVLGSAVSESGCHPSAFLFTGHRDGRVRIWDTCSSVPKLLMSVPMGESISGERLRAVTALEVCSASGILAVGHENGDLRVYQFSDRQQVARRASLDESLVPYDTMIAQAAGFQYILKYDGTHDSVITSLALSSGDGILLVGDSFGIVSCIDLNLPSQRWKKWLTRDVDPKKDSENGISNIALGIKKAHYLAKDGEVQCAVISTSDSSIALISVLSGNLMGYIQPKTRSEAMGIILLDSYGVPNLPYVGSLILPWADNNSVSAVVNTMKTPASGIMGVVSSDIDIPNFSSSNSLEVHSLPSEEDEGLGEALRNASEAEGVSIDRNEHHGRFKIFRRRSISPSKLKQEGESSKSVTLIPEVSDINQPLSPALSSSASSLATPENIKAQNIAGPVHKYGKNTSFKSRPINDEIDTSADLWGNSNHQMTRRNSGLRSLDASLDLSKYCHMDFTLESSLELKKISRPDPEISYESRDLNTTSGRAAKESRDVEECNIDVNKLKSFEACYIVLIAVDSIRIYSFDSLIKGDRLTERKIKIGPIIFSSPFMGASGPGIASISNNGFLSVHSIPNLKTLYGLNVVDEPNLGFPWSTSDVQSAVLRPACSCSPDGQLFLINSQNEITRVGLIEDAIKPLLPESVCSSDTLESSANEARILNDETASNSSLSSSSEALDKFEDNENEPSSSRKNSGTASNILSSVRGIAMGVVDNVSSTVSALQPDFQNKTRMPNALPPRQLPSLKKLLSTPVSSLKMDLNEEFQGLHVSNQDSMEDGGRSQPENIADRAKGLATAAIHQGGAKIKQVIQNPPWKTEDKAAVLASQQAESRRKEEAIEHERRMELLGETPSSLFSQTQGSAVSIPSKKSSKKIQKRTVSEVRRHYGHNRAQDARITLENNRQMLAQRGEKLKDIQKRSEMMANDAEGFADLAKQLEESMQARKWWQL